jgi:hypothetical protein
MDEITSSPPIPRLPAQAVRGPSRIVYSNISKTFQNVSRLNPIPSLNSGDSEQFFQISDCGLSKESELFGNSSLICFAS